MIHNVDLAWAILATLCAVYPLQQLRWHWHWQSARDLAGLILTFAAYPWAMAVFHLTHFDKGLVYAICLFSIPTYAVIMLRFIGYSDDVAKKPRVVWFAIAAALALLALSNPWHGQFAQFETPTIGQPNHLLDYEIPNVGAVLTAAFAALTITAIVIMTTLQMVRSRLVFWQFFLSVVLPLCALALSAHQSNWQPLRELQIDGYFVVTTLALLCLNYFIARERILEVLPITYTKIIGLVPDAIVIVGGEDKISDCNPAFERLCNHRSANIIGQRITELLPATDCIVGDIVENQQLSLSVGGQTKHLDLRITPISFGDYGSSGRMVLFRDVTEQTTAYHQLHSAISE